MPISEEGQTEAQSSCSGLTGEFRHMPGMKSGSTDRAENAVRISVGLGGQFPYRIPVTDPVLFTAEPTGTCRNAGGHSPSKAVVAWVFSQVSHLQIFVARDPLSYSHYPWLD